MKSKLFTKKSLIAAALVLVLLIGGSFVANKTVVADRLEQKAYEKEYGLQYSSDGLLYLKYDPSDDGKIGHISMYLGDEYCLEVSDVPAYDNGNKLVYIDENAYRERSEVEKVILPQTIEAIADNAFSDCESLKEIYIPASVTQIADNAFSGTKNFTMYVEENSYAQDFAEQNGIPYEFYTPKSMVDTKDYDYSKSIREMECVNDYTYDIYYYNGVPNCAIHWYNPLEDTEDVVVPEQIEGVDVTTIKSEAFSGRSGKNIILPDTVTNVGSYAFAEHHGLEKVYFTKNVTRIGKDIFKGLPNAVICAPKDSYAYEYAIENNIKFEETN